MVYLCFPHGVSVSMPLLEFEQARRLLLAVQVSRVRSPESNTTRYVSSSGLILQKLFIVDISAKSVNSIEYISLFTCFFFFFYYLPRRLLFPHVNPLIIRSITSPSISHAHNTRRSSAASCTLPKLDNNRPAVQRRNPPLQGSRYLLPIGLVLSQPRSPTNFLMRPTFTILQPPSPPSLMMCGHPYSAPRLSP